MILKKLKVFLQNIGKNKLLTNILLEINKDFNIILIQKPSWLTIQAISSSSNKKGKIIIEASNHPN